MTPLQEMKLVRGTFDRGLSDAKNVIKNIKVMSQQVYYDLISIGNLYTRLREKLVRGIKFLILA